MGNVARGEGTRQRVLIPKLTSRWETCTFPGEIWRRMLLLPVKSSQAEPFPHPVRARGLDSVLVCILILGLPFSGCSSPCIPEPRWPQPRPCGITQDVSPNTRTTYLRGCGTASRRPSRPPGASSVLFLLYFTTTQPQGICPSVMPKLTR